MADLYPSILLLGEGSWAWLCSCWSWACWKVALFGVQLYVVCYVRHPFLPWFWFL